VIPALDISSMETSNPAYNQALKFAARGIGVFALHGIDESKCTCGKSLASKFCAAGKHPRNQLSFKGATTSAASIEALFSKHKAINYGIATGREIGNSKKMIVVVDIDAYKPETEITLAELEKAGCCFPDTAEVLTGGKGRHLYYLAEVGTKFQATLGKGIDLKGIGGYVVGPGSLHKSGDRYDWEGSSDLFEGQEMADLPRWVYEKFSKGTPARKPTATESSADATVDDVESVDANSNVDVDVDVDDAEIESYKAMLNDIPADEYGNWRDGLMALKSRSTSEKMFALADWWSKKSTSYKGTADVRAKWNQISPNGGITIKSLRRLADQERAKDTKDVDLSMIMAEPPKSMPMKDLWCNPEPLTSSGVAEIYPFDALPEVMRGAVSEVEAYTKAPQALVACSALASLSLAAQALYDVKRDEGLTGPVSLFLMPVAESGERKSTLDSYFIQPMRDYENACATAAKPEIAKFNTDMQRWEAKNKGILEKLTSLAKTEKDCSVDDERLSTHHECKPVPPLVPRLIYGDVTQEALTSSLAAGWPSGGVISSEGGAILGGHAMKRDNQMGNMAAFNELWDGKPIRVDRRTTGSYSVKGTRLTVAVQVQPATLQAFMKGSGPLARGSGYLARFLICHPTSTQGTRLYQRAPAQSPKLDRFRKRIADILAVQPVIEEGALKPSMLTFTDDAMDAWINFYNDVELQLGAGGELRDVRDVASKTADNAARLAALFHVLEDGNGSISLNHMQGATRLARWHLNESQRILAGTDMTADMQNATLLEEWLVAACKRGGVTALALQDLSQRGPNSLRTKDVRDAALSTLAGLGRVQIVPGSPRLVEVNPKLL
jgi:hypothetical protein